MEVKRKFIGPISEAIHALVRHLTLRLSGISAKVPSLPARVYVERGMGLSTTNFIPTDVFYLILEHLTDRRDLYAAALTSRDFNRAATPLLYRTLDTDTPSNSVWGRKTVRSFGHFLKPSVDLNFSRPD